MPDTTVKPAIRGRIVRFHRVHNVSANMQPQGALHHTANVATLGFLRGNDVAVGDKIKVTASNGTKVWEGTVTQRETDQFENEVGPAWFFEVKPVSYERGPAQEDTIAVTVTVTSASSGQTSDPVRAQPDPNDVP